MIEAVIIHIGTEKTGTTSIQHFFHENREYLLSMGIYYPTTPMTTNGNHRRLATYCLPKQANDELLEGLADDEKDAWRENFKREFSKELQKVADSDTSYKVVLSSEHLCVRLQNPRVISNLKDLLTPYCKTMEVVVYLRRQDQLAASLYTTRLLAGDTGEHLLPPNRNSARYNYDSLLNRWAQVFGSSCVTPRVYAKGRLRSDVVGDFMRVICGETKFIANIYRLILPSRQNQSFSVFGQYILRLINLCQAKGILSPEKGSDMRLDLKNSKWAFLHGKGRLPTREAAQQFYDLFDESNKAVADRWFYGNLFDDDFLAYRPSGNGAVQNGKT